MQTFGANKARMLMYEPCVFTFYVSAGNEGVYIGSASLQNGFRRHTIASYNKYQIHKFELASSAPLRRYGFHPRTSSYICSIHNLPDINFIYCDPSLSSSRRARHQTNFKRLKCLTNILTTYLLSRFGNL